MSHPKIWPRAKLATDAATARAAFRRFRLDEPLNLYKEFFVRFRKVFESLIDVSLPALMVDRGASGTMADLMARKDVRDALRYLAAPPISEDDLITLAETRLSAAALKKDSAAAKRVRDLLLHVLDTARFPWIAQKRRPTVTEREAAVIASAAMIAARQVETVRRKKEKTAQEDAVRKILESCKFVEVPTRNIRHIGDAPTPSQFCRESRLGDTKADFVVVLADRRLLAIECKASNSAVNSFKRLVHEAAGKASKWTTAFGKAQIIPAAVISGVFSVDNLELAQRQGLFFSGLMICKNLRHS